MGTVRTHTLKPHPLNRKLYGDPQVGPDFDELRDSIKEKGVLVPLLITKDNVIVSGHSRWFMAKMFSIDTLEANVIATTDEAEIDALVIHTNRQRARNNEVKAREFKELKRIEAERAKARQGKRTDLQPDIPENLPESSSDARDLAAKHVGWTGKTAEKAEKVLAEIDRLRALGAAGVGRAEELTKLLNEKSVDAAYKEAFSPKAKSPKPPKPEPKSHPDPEPIPENDDELSFDDEADSDPADILVDPDERKQYEAIVARWNMDIARLWDAAGEYVRAAFLQYVDNARV